MKKESDFDMAKSKHPLFQTMVEISKLYDSRLQEINLQALNVFSNNEWAHTLQDIGEKVSWITAGPKDTVPESLKEITESIGKSYANVFSSGDHMYPLSDAMIDSLSLIQTDTMFQLSRCTQTDMIKNLTTCFAQAGYASLPRIVTESLSKPFLCASDIAFLRTAKLLPTIEDEVLYPYGFKTSLSNLNAGTAEDLMDDDEITYDTHENCFVTTYAEARSSEMNVICAGKIVFNSSCEKELFSEKDLMNFSSFLSRTPMLAMIDGTGKKIFDLIKNMYESGERRIDFDKDCYYHSRNRNKGVAPYTAELMLKAPHGLPGTGRYNHAGQSHYYYADTQNGAENEVKKYLKKDEITQTIRLIPTKPIRLLDLSGTMLRGKVFLRYIRFPLSDIQDKTPREYLIPGFVADCCRAIGFDGIKYYGSQEYNNYVSWDDGYFKDGGMC